MSPPALILAGGRASRMGGGDKVLLLLNGTPLLAHVMARLAPQVSAMALSANGDPERFSAFGLTVVPDRFADYPGPMAGVHAGLIWAQSLGAAHLLTVSGDTPFLPADLVARLQAHKGPATAILAQSGERVHPTIGLWDVAALPAFEKALEAGERALYPLARQLGAVLAHWDAVPHDPFFNINTPDDLEKAARLTG